MFSWKELWVSNLKIRSHLIKGSLYTSVFALDLFPPEAEYEMQIQEQVIYLGGSTRAAR